MNSRVVEFLIVSTAIGIIATFAAPWYELRGTFAAWRIVVADRHVAGIHTR